VDGEIGKRLLVEGESKFIRGLCYHDSGSRNFYGKFPVLTPQDLNDRKIRVMNSATAINMVEAMGAAPTPISPGELYSALSQGIVDGAENNLPTFAHSANSRPNNSNGCRQPPPNPPRYSVNSGRLQPKKPVRLSKRQV